MNTTDNNNPLARLRHHVTGAIERGEATPIVAQDKTTPMNTTDNTTNNTEFTSYKPTDNQPQFRLPPNCRYIECEDRKTAELAFAQLAIRPTAQDHIRDLHDAATRFEDRAKQAEAQRDAAVAALREADRVCTLRGHEFGWQAQARAAIAAAESEGQ